MRTYEQEQYPSETPAQRTRRELADARAGVETTHRFISEELPFLFDLQQYQHDPNRTRRGDRIQPVDAAPYDAWQFQKGTVLQNAPIHLRCEPVDKDGDAIRAEAFKHRISYQLNANRYCNYADVRERWIGGALAARAWAYRWDYVPYLGEFGECVPRLVDPRMLFVPQGYLTPHDPLCPRMHEVFRIPVNEARRMPNWKHTAELRSDRGDNVMDWVQHSVTARDDHSYFNDGVSRDGQQGGDGMVTLCMTWYRFEEKGVKVPKEIPLEKGDRYLQCLNEACNFKSPREFELAEAFETPGFELPPQTDCEKCGATMRRVSKETKTEEQIRLESGKRLVITCLNGSVEEPLFDGAWPVPDCPTFPYAWLTCEKEPHRLYPESRVSVHWTDTVGRNFTMATIYEQAHSSRAVFMFPRRGIEDRNGMALDDMDELADVLFYTSDMPPDGVKVLQGKPVNSDLFKLYDMLHGAYLENKGDARMSFAPGDSKDVAVGTIREMVDSGNVGINAFIQAVYAAESISFTILAAYLRKFDTQGRWIRYRNQMGKMMFDMVKGVGLPDVDVVCSAGPTLTNVKAEEIAAGKELAALPAPIRRLLGRSMGVDESFMDEMDEAQRMIPPQPGVAPAGQPQPVAPQSSPSAEAVTA